MSSVFILLGQCPDFSFPEIESSICIGENINLSEADYSNIRWTFCEGNFDDPGNPIPIIEDLDAGGRVYGLELLKIDNDYYGFFVSRANKLFRIYFGENVDNNYTISELSPIGAGLLNEPLNIKLVESGSGFVGFIANYGNKKLLSINFGNNLLADNPVIEEFADLGYSVFDVEVQKLEGYYYVFTSAYASNIIKQFKVDPYGLGILSSSSIEISGGSDFRYFTSKLKCDSLYLFPSDFSTGKIFRVKLNENYDALIQSEEVATVTNPLDLFFPKLYSQSILLVQTRQGRFYKLDFDSDIESTPTINELTGAKINRTDVFGLTGFVGSDSLNWTMLAMESSRQELYAIDFTETCNASIAYSNGQNTSVSYNQSGVYSLSLSVRDNSLYSTSTANVTVTSSHAPNITFTVDEGRCLTNPNTFIPTILSGTIDTYSWDLDGDGTEDSADPNPSFQYSTPGTYDIHLDVVSDEGCGNFVEEQITIYPEPPTPSFDISGTECSGTELTFINTTNETGYADAISYSWDFNGEGSSLQTNTVFTFENNGSKYVTLVSHIPGCSSAPVTREVVLETGPQVDFEWTNNCYEEVVQFINNTNGEGVLEYSWDFGDGSPMNFSEEPSHLYASVGSYRVSLTVLNEADCETTIEKELVINDDNLANILDVEGEENVPVNFVGEDRTLSGDEVITWSWDFDGLGGATGKEVDFIFSIPGTYLVTLDVTTGQGCSDQVFKEVVIKESSCPTVNFDLSAIVCQGENVSLLNESANAISYEWDFCVGDDLQKTPEAKQILPENSFGSSYYLELVKDGENFYGFVPTRSTNRLIRLDFGDSIGLHPVYNDLGISGGLWSDPAGVSIRKINDKWLGLAVGYNSEELYLLDFGADIPGTPSIVDITGDLAMVGPMSVHLEFSGGNYYGFIVNFTGGKINKLNFGTELSTSYTSSDIVVTGGSQLSDIDFARSCDQYYAFVTSRGNGKIYRLDFGSDLDSNPTQQEITTALDFTMDNPVGIAITSENEDYQMFITSRNGPIYRLDFEETLTNIPTGVELGNLNGLSEDWSLEPVRIGSKWYLIGANFGGKLFRYSFPDACMMISGGSGEQNPSNLSYRTAGEKTIKLTAYDEAGNKNSIIKNLTVTSSQAPDISLTLNETRCITSPTTFTSFNTSGDITSYFWDFNGDGIEDSTDPNPTFQYDTPGTYDVRLDVVSDEGCSNFVEEQITLYPEPPMPSFDIAGTLCNGMEIAFANTTDETGFEEALSYSWDFNGEGASMQEDTVFAFSESGSKTITLTASIPGCSTTTTRVIELKTGPQVDFTWSENCFGDIIQFQNLTSGSDVTAYSWDFGDGYTSTEAEPEHVYAQTGTYELVLTAYNEAGCASTLSKEIIIEAIPSPYFEYGLACEGQELVLQDMSEVENSQIIAWEWYVDDATEPVSEEPNAEVLLESSDSEIIRLVVYAANGCEASYSRSVDVREIPSVSFSSEIGCIGEVSGFVDKTPDPDRTASRSWFVNGQLIHAETSAQFDTVFAEPGTYEVELVVNNQNFCSGSYKDTVEILALPTLAFEVLGECKGEPISVRDISGSAADSLVSRTWYLDGKQVGNGTEAFLPVTESGSYEVMLSASTKKGCNIALTKRIDIFPKPVADFTASNDYGVPPFHISFENQSENASYYQWFLDGEQVSTEENVTLSFTDEGIKKIKLIAQNDQGCTDSLSFAINSAVPVVDIVLNKIQLIQDDNGHGVLLDISNKSNIPVEHVQAKITLENDFEITETISRRIDVNQQAVERLNMSFPVGAGNLSYLCVTLFSPYQEEDQTPANNENCINVESRAIIEAPFPNPSVGRTTVRAVLPAAGDVDLMIVDMTGQVRLLEQLPSRPKGLNTFVIDLLKLDAGTYFLTIDFKGKTYKTRIIKQ